MKSLILSAMAAAMLAMSNTGASAQANPYAEIVETRILSGWQLDDGTVMAGLEITLAPGWKTYWRAPGDVGIPPMFDWTRSRNLRGVEISWPTPQVFRQNGSRTIGYQDRVVLPISIAPRRNGTPVRLNGTLDIGICGDVCVPVRVSIKETLENHARKPDPLIAAALADRPFSPTEAGLKGTRCDVSPLQDGMALRAEFMMPSTGGREMAVVETGDPMVWASEPKITRKGGKLVAEFELLHANGGSFAIDRSSLRFTILGTSHAVDIQGCVH